MRTAVNYAWKVERNRGSELVASEVMMVGPRLLALTFRSQHEPGRRRSGWRGHRGLPVAAASARPDRRSTATLSLVFGVGLIFYFVPTAKVRFRDVSVGATLTGLLWRVRLPGWRGGCVTCRATASTGRLARSWSSSSGIYSTFVGNVLYRCVELATTYSRLLRGRDEAARDAAPRRRDVAAV